MSRTYTQLQTKAQAMALSANATDAAIFVNDAYVDVVRRCKLNPKTSTETLTAGTWSYTISGDFGITDFLALDVLLYQTTSSGILAPLEPVGEETILTNQTGTLRGQVRQYAMRGLNTILVYPAPDTGGTLQVYYQGTPTALSSGSDVPSLIPSEYQEILAWGAAARLAQEEDLALAANLEQQYENELAQLLGLKNQASASVPKKVRVGYPWKPRGKPRSGRNDVYPEQ